MVLDAVGNPIMRLGDEANPYIFYNLYKVVEFANKQKKENKTVSIVEIITLEIYTNPK